MTNYLKNTYNNTSLKNIELLIEYLKKIGGKPLLIACRRQNAFKLSWTSRDKMLISRCHIQNAVDYLEYIKTDYSEKQIKVVIADLASHIKTLDKNEDVDFILMSTNTLPSAIHFDIATKLFFNHQIREQNQDNYSTDILTLYSIRLALESRVRGLLGIDYAVSKGKNIGLSTLIKISKNLTTIEYSKEIDWGEIDWINKWLNHNMHRHIRPYPWSIFQALESLKFFIDPKDPLIKDGRKIYSFYSTTYVEDESSYEKEVETKLKNQYPDIEIKWSYKKEILKSTVANNR
ncbi:hypothetical protein [Flammeovirga kamogawensis]|uniref:Uncharacterized protein n=1 Tax=Flammeovirga kamogawensis TaxID=373891 RepID=A0ABX8H528_9BACT|nr:hypothetical protein [Flammeovirga kamogawensis]MBB6461849.1 hypothetical protein [Flammeovirga kamogawensis]QWG10536.1 hypothetical protein KM029_26550 [Flammeovirga kamogawensis]TRX63645.1 hypothetical protein EO216_24825 [Flammeovirga kamogawensis]